MNEFAIIIPSKTVGNLKPCISAIREAKENCQIIVVNDGLDLDQLNHSSSGDDCWSCKNDPLFIMPGETPFVFARNMNKGIERASAIGAHDVVLLNDDALLKTPGGFSLLWEAIEEKPDIGIISPVTNVTGAREQMPRGVGLRVVDKMAFVCVYIPRRTINAVGLLDERFVTYGWEDNDYIHRVKLAGLKIAVHDHVFVDHGSLTSTFRGGARAAGDIEPGRKIFQEKWGISA